MNKPARINQRTDKLWGEMTCGLIDYFRLFIVATGCTSARRPQETVSCYGG